MDYLDSMRFIYNKISELSFKKLDEYVTEMAKLLQKPKSEKSDLYIDIQYKEQFFTKYPEVISFSPPIEGWYGVTTNELSKVYFLIKKNPSLSVKEAVSRLMQEEIMRGIKGQEKLKTLRGRIKNKLWNLKMKRALEKERAINKKRDDYCKEHGLNRIE